MTVKIVQGHTALDQLQTCIGELELLQADIGELKAAATVFGFNDLNYRLRSIQIELIKNVARLNAAHTQLVADRVAAAEEASRNILNVGLAVAKVGQAALANVADACKASGSPSSKR